MLQGVQTISLSDFNKGLYTSLNILKNEKGQSPNCMNIKWNFDGGIQKRLGHSTTNTVVIGSTIAAGWTLDVANTLTNNLSAMWKLNETSGDRSDEYGGNNLTDINTVGFNPGIRGNAAQFVAANSESLLRATTGPLQTGDIDFFMSGWIYLDSTSTTLERTIISKRDPAVDAATSSLLHCDGADASTTFTSNPNR